MQGPMATKQPAGREGMRRKRNHTGCSQEGLVEVGLGVSRALEGLPTTPRACPSPPTHRGCLSGQMGRAWGWEGCREGVLRDCKAPMGMVWDWVGVPLGVTRGSRCMGVLVGSMGRAGGGEGGAVAAAAAGVGAAGVAAAGAGAVRTTIRSTPRRECLSRRS